MSHKQNRLNFLNNTIRLKAPLSFIDPRDNDEQSKKRKQIYSANEFLKNQHHRGLDPLGFHPLSINQFDSKEYKELTESEKQDLVIYCSSMDISPNELIKFIKLKLNGASSRVKDETRKLSSPASKFNFLVPKDILEMLIEQGFRSYYSECILICKTSWPNSMSIDRLDENLPYQRDNILLCTAGENHERGRYTTVQDYKDMEEEKRMFGVIFEGKEHLLNGRISDEDDFI